MDKGIVYYTNNILDEAINTLVQRKLLEVNLPIVSVSLKPINFGKNIVFNSKPGIITMTKQIMIGLEEINSDVVFFAEHDILYHQSHFDFIPNDSFCYNTNVWRFDYPYDRLITYDHLRSLSGLCAKRDLLLKHYNKRLKFIENNNCKDDSREPIWIRKLGHEPGKSKSRLLEKCSEWKSEYPNIDIRHNRTITKRKCRLEDFKHQPTNWQETTLDKIPGWNLKEIFEL